MLGTQDLALFVLSGLLLNVTPGPDTLYIVARGSTQGLRAGVLAALGIGAGTLVHMLAAAFGLSALLAASTTAFLLVKWAGAIYLVYLGVTMLLRDRSAHPGRTPGLAPATPRRVFAQGFLTNVLNPKVGLFFIAFLPQFVAPEAESKALAFLFLGAIFNFNGTLWNLLVACLAAGAAGQLRRSASLLRWFDRCVGSFFVYLGIRLAFARPG